MPVAIASFVAEELTGVAAQVARHRYGCRVIVRLLEHSSGTDACTISLVDELLIEAPELLRHSYGHFVVQAILEHGLPHHRHCIVFALRGQDSDMLRNAMNRHGSCVIETALLYCSPEDKHAICEELLSEPYKILSLAQSQFGCFVLQALLAWPGKRVQAVMDLIQEASADLSGSKPGQKTLQLLGFDELVSVSVL